MIRVKVPNGVKLMPHRHSEDRIYTVISGVFYIGVGEEFDPDKLEAYPKLIHYGRFPKGTHFAAWEQPELFVDEMRASFKSLRLA